MIVACPGAVTATVAVAEVAGAVAVASGGVLHDALTWAGEHGFGLLDAFVFSLNVLLFVAAGPIVRAFAAVSDEGAARRRARSLRVVNVALFLLYFVAYFVSDLARPLAQTGLTILLGFLASHSADVLAVRRHGREREIEGVTYRSGTYQSQLFAMVSIAAIVIVCGLVILNIWGRDRWLQATSVLGGILVALYATKDVWLPDHVAALILLHDGDVQPGTLIRSDELGLLGITLRTSLTRTVFKDLVHRHEVVVPNRRLRAARLEILSRGPEAGIWQHVDFKIGYEHDATEVTTLLEDAWENACASDRGINAGKPPRIRVVETGDHAVTWRLFYVLSNIYRLLPARFTVLRETLDLSRERGIGLNTPLTHVIEEGDAPG